MDALISSTTISFYINAETEVELKISDLQGKELKTVLKQSMYSGEHKVLIDLSDFPQGYYIYTIKAGPLLDSKQFQIVR